MADFIQALDPTKLVQAEAVLSFFISPFAAPPYNLAIFLFGTIANGLDSTDATQYLQLFTGLLGASTIFDVLWMVQNEQNGFVRLLTFIILLLKFPTFLAFASALRQRGVQFSGFSIRGGDLSGPTVWSMPGGFTSGSHDGYQTVGEESSISNPQHVAPATASRPSDSLTAPGAYQSV